MSKEEKSRQTDKFQTGASAKPSWKARLLKWVSVGLLILLAMFFAFRWAGTSVERGVVQRVYEKESEYRVEFATLDGEVLVSGNRDVRFPYFKVDTADIHAELNRLATTGDIVDLKVWGFRMPFFSMFPNVIDVDFVRSNAERRRQRAEYIADRVIETLMRKGVLDGGEGLRPELTKEVEKGLEERLVAPAGDE